MDREQSPPPRLSYIPPGPKPVPDHVPPGALAASAATPSSHVEVRFLVPHTRPMAALVALQDALIALPSVLEARGTVERDCAQIAVSARSLPDLLHQLTTAPAFDGVT